MSKKTFYDFRLLLLRHGQTEANSRGAFLGRLNQPLSETGASQALHLAKLLRDEPIHALFTSPLKRTVATAEAIARLKEIPLVSEHDLIEQDFGAWDGKTFAQVKEEFPDDFDAWWLNPNQAPTGGESLQVVADRIHGFFKRLQMEQGQTIALVGHGSASQALLCRLFGIPTRGLWPFRLQNGTVTEVQFLKGLPTMTRLSWNG